MHGRRRMGGIMGSQRAEVIQMAEMFRADPLANLEDALSARSLKRRDFYATYRGDMYRPVIDGHIGEALYGKDWSANDVDMYRRASDLLKSLADQAGATPA